MPSLDLSDKERLMLANQYEILSRLEKNKAQADDYALTADTLRQGHKWLYKQIFDVIAPNLSESDTQHVLTILDIYGALRDSFNALTDKSDIEPHNVEFPGFDGNNESDLLSFAESLIKHGRYRNTLGREAKNSHSHTTEIYERMIECWRELGEPHYPYSKEMIRAILDARIHPSHRKTA